MLIIIQQLAGESGRKWWGVWEEACLPRPAPQCKAFLLPLRAT